MGLKRNVSHRRKTPQDDAGKEVNHVETTPNAGHDAYPCLFVDLDAVEVQTRRRNRTRDSAPFSLPVFAKLKRPVAFTMRMTREVPLVVDNEWRGSRHIDEDATYKSPSNSSIPPKACPYSRTAHPLGTMFRVVCTHIRGRRHGRLPIGLW